MLERFVLRSSNDENYVDIFLLAVFFTLLSAILVQQMVVFEVSGTNLGGLITVLLTSLAVSYPFVSYIIEEEEAEMRKRWSEKRLLRRHSRQLELYLSFFLGVTLAIALSTFFVPEQFYSVQMQVLDSIRAPAGSITADGMLMDIISNNLWVLTITFVLTFFLSSGILFVLTWNASVLGVLVGALSNSAIEVPFITALYLPHGSLEVGGYILAGIAGSMLSYRVEAEVAGDVDPPVRATVTRDVLVLLALSVVLILIAGVIEVL